jgi:hypothetical protein
MAVKPQSPLKLRKSVSHIIQSRLLSASTAASSYVCLRGNNPQLEAEKLHGMEFDAPSRR